MSGTIIMQNEKKEAIEAELRCLHSALDASSSDYGDWTMARALERLILDLANCEESQMVSTLKTWLDSTATELASIMAQRATARARINELEAQLDG